MLTFVYGSSLQCGKVISKEISSSASCYLMKSIFLSFTYFPRTFISEQVFCSLHIKPEIKYGSNLFMNSIFTSVDTIHSHDILAF